MDRIHAQAYNPAHGDHCELPDHAVEQLVLEGDSYRLPGKRSDSIELSARPGVTVDLIRVW